MLPVLAAEYGLSPADVWALDRFELEAFMEHLKGRAGGS